MCRLKHTPVVTFVGAQLWLQTMGQTPSMQVSEAAASGARVAMNMNTELVFAHAEQALANANTSAMKGP